MINVKIEQINSRVDRLSKKKVKEYNKVKAALKALGSFQENGMIKDGQSYLQDAVKEYRKGLINKSIPIKRITLSTSTSYPGLSISPVSGDYKSDVPLGVFFKSLKETLNGRIRDARVHRREITREDRVVTGSFSRDDEQFNWELVAGVHTTPGKFLQIKNFESVKQVMKEKKPKSNDNHVGIELEFFCKWEKNKLAQALFDAGLAKFVHLGSDGSINDYGDNHPYELRILAKDNEYKEVIKKVTEILSMASARINKSCGMHVHIDMRNRNKEVVFANLVSAQPQLYAMNPLSREQGTYCKKTEGKTFNANMDRYHGINARAYNEHKTIEVRIHSATVEYAKIVNWVDILLAIASKPADMGNAVRTTDKFVERYNLSNEIKLYMESRIDKFTKQRNGETIEEEVA